MLNIYIITKERYETLTVDEKMHTETIFLVKDTQGHGSIYVQGVCYGEDLNDEEINNRLDSLETELDNFEIATNFDILEILNK